MTPQRWKGAGVALLVVAALLIVAALVSVLASAQPGPVGFALYQPTNPNLLGPDNTVLRGVVLGAFAGVAFFLGLACFVWSALAEAAGQRAEILAELTALRTRAEQIPGLPDNPDQDKGAQQP